MTRRWPLNKRDYDGAHLRRKEFRAFLAEHYRLADIDAHELVFGELVANAVRYGDEPISVCVAVSDGFIQIRVENGGECFNLDRGLANEPEPTAIRGRGLHIVRALVETLTVDRLPFHSCRVTATLRLSSAFS